MFVVTRYMVLPIKGRYKKPKESVTSKGQVYKNVVKVNHD